MSETTVTQTKPAWIFTFGAGHTTATGESLANRFVRIAGEWGEARDTMVRHFGTVWCDQYADDAEDRAGVVEFGLTELPRDEWPTAPAAAAHYQARGWKGDEPGSCGVECACGLGYDGFDTLGEASALLDKHIADETGATPAERPTKPVAGLLDEIAQLRMDLALARQQTDRYRQRYTAALAFTADTIGAPDGPAYDTYATTPAEIAAALRRAARDIDAMGDVELSPVAVAINLQAVMHGGEPADRMTTVDALSVALLGQAGELPDGRRQYQEPVGMDHARGDVRVDIYTGMPAEPAAEPTNPDRRCRNCGATSGLAMLPYNPLTLDPQQWECQAPKAGCKAGAS